jgi:hypothetical protein
MRSISLRNYNHHVFWYTGIVATGYDKFERKEHHCQYRSLVPYIVLIEF